MQRYYLTTTLPYVNAKPHIGFALELVQADSWVRYHALKGDEVFFNTGTDEHGQKIWEAAQKEGKDINAYVDFYAEEFRNLKTTLGLSPSLSFIRTTSPEHQMAAQEIWRRCKEKGDIEKRSYEGLYCVGCEKFLTGKEIIGTKCHIHGTEPQLLKEENWFFRLSRYQDALLKYLEGDVIIPDWRKQEAINFVKEGLEDFSISREKSRLSWGIPVPGDDTQVMYVWFDALTSYISTLGWPSDPKGNFRKYWEEARTLQMAGKDQVRFQSVMWQAMLMSAGIKNTDFVFYHGFINSDGQKMSKSIGNVISPDDLIAKYGTEATRYLLLRHVHSTEDTDITWEKLDEWYTAGLVNGLGNLVSRVMQMAASYLKGPVDLSKKKGNDSLELKLEKFEFQSAMDHVWSEIARIDELIQEEEPFKLIKTDKAAAQLQVANYVNEISRIAVNLRIFMPQTAEHIESAIAENKKPENLFPRLL